MECEPQTEEARPNIPDVLTTRGHPYVQSARYHPPTEAVYGECRPLGSRLHSLFPAYEQGALLTEI